MARPLLVLLPGGAGLFCDSLNDIRQEFAGDDLLCIDPPNESDDWSYSALLRYVESKLPRDRDLVLVGHSFGGIQAADIATRRPRVVGLICLAAPFSKVAFASINQEFSKKMTPELELAGKEFNERPSDESFKKWLASYGTLYFYPDHAHAGAKMLLTSPANHRAFLDSCDEAGQKEHLLDEVRKSKFAKAFLYGASDELFVKQTARIEGERGGFEVHEIPHAGHFMAFDNPKQTNSVIRNFLERIQSITKGDL